MSLPKELSQACQCFRLLGHPTKLQVFRLVMEELEPVVPTLVASRLKIPLNRVSYSLLKLHECGLLDRSTSGRYSLYSFNSDTLETLKELL